MAVVLVVVAVGLVVGTAVWLVLWRWPGADPASPRVAAGAVAREVLRHPLLESAVEREPDPATATGLALTAAIVLAAAGVVGAGALFVMVQANVGFARWDQSLGRWGADHATSASTTALRDLSLLGGTTVIVVLVVVVFVVEYIRTRQLSIAGFLATVIVGITLLVNVTKLVVDRDRPDIRQLTGFSGSSFPSGHAATAAATFAALALLLGLRRSRMVRTALAGTAAGIAAMVATTRVMLGVHWFTDVLAGIALGWAWFAVCSIAFGGRLMRFGAPIEIAEWVSESTSASPPSSPRQPSSRSPAGP